MLERAAGTSSSVSLHSPSFVQMVLQGLSNFMGSGVGIFVAVAAVAFAAKFLFFNGKPTKSNSVPKTSTASSASTTTSAKPAAKPVVKPGAVLKDPAVYQKFPLAQRIEINHNTRIFRFALPKPTDTLGLPIGQHLSLKAHVDGKDVYRSYTPVSSDDDKGHFDLLIKVYEKGAMTKFLDAMNIGDTIDVRGPKGSFVYTPNMRKSFGMLAGGTGVTPMLQVIRAILKNPADKTEIRLIFANVNEEDILLKKELDMLAVTHSNFKVYYVLNNPPAGWTGGVGFVGKGMIESNCHPSNDDTMMLLCGPPPMIKAMQAHLTDLNFKEEHIFSF